MRTAGASTPHRYAAVRRDGRPVEGRSSGERRGMPATVPSGVGHSAAARRRTRTVRAR
jgi:hypothetical protein